MFDDWLESCDRLLTSVTGLSIHSLPDFTWHDAYSEGISPAKGLAAACDYWAEWDEMPADVAEAIKRSIGEGVRG